MAVRRAKTKPTKCLNLRQIQDARKRQLWRTAKGLVDLTARMAEQQQRTDLAEKLARTRALKNARYLLDLSKKKQAPAEIIFKEPPAPIRPAAAPKTSAPEKKVSAKAKSFSPSRITKKKAVTPKGQSLPPPITPVVREVEKTFPEYFATVSGDKQFPLPAKRELLTPIVLPAQKIDFLKPALELPAELPTARLVRPQTAAVPVVAGKLPVRKFRRRSLAAFIVSIILLTGAVGVSAGVQRAFDSQDKIISQATAGADSLRSAAAYLQQQNFLQAITDFERAAGYFSQAERDINDIGQVTSRLLAWVPQGKAAISLVQAGQAMSESGQSLAKAAGYFRQVDGIFAEVDFASASEKNLNLAEALLLARAEFDGVSNKLQLAQQNFAAIKPETLPAAFRDDFIEADEILQVLAGATAYFRNFSDQMAAIIGANGPRRYLVFFANSDEMRGSLGGFPGSYVILDFSEGKIKSLDFKDIYEIRGQQDRAIVPPRQFQLITGNLEIQDAAGWPLDYQQAAAKAREYYQLSRVGTTVDGVWTISSDIIPDLLAITGPIEMPDYGLTVTTENYLEVLESEVESDAARLTGQPKKIVEKLLEKILSRIFDQKRVDWFALLGTMSQSLANKKILLNFTDEKLQEFAVANDAAGQIKDGDNYLAVFTYNIGGGKTDKDISEEIQQVSSLNNNGDLHNSVTITRQHGLESDLDELSRVKNISWVKVVLPKNAEILQVAGEDQNYPAQKSTLPGAVPDEDFAVLEKDVVYLNDGRVALTTEADKKVVGFWMGIEPSTKRTVEIKYRVPGVIDFSKYFKRAYGFTSVFQTQPGKDNTRFSGRLSFPPRSEISWQEASGAFINNYGDNLSWTVDNARRDIVVSAVVDNPGLK
jgi:hypothetical protein